MGGGSSQSPLFDPPGRYTGNSLVFLVWVPVSVLTDNLLCTVGTVQSRFAASLTLCHIVYGSSDTSRDTGSGFHLLDSVILPHGNLGWEIMVSLANKGATAVSYFESKLTSEVSSRVLRRLIGQTSSVSTLVPFTD